jgi:hypothetical protein
MENDQLQRRRQTYFKLSSAIAQIDNAQVRSLVAADPAQIGWGKSQTITIERAKVFVKRVPLTDREYAHMFSTRNVYDLPTYYNYGIGSAGLGVFRELVTHIKTTNWVLEGAIASFPLLYHYRIIPWSGEREAVDLERHARYVSYWGGDANIGSYLLDRASASYELVLFLEHIPHTVAPWLMEHPKKTALVIADMQATITFLRRQGILHLDTGFFNMLTDGRQTYLSDFGLALDRQFALTPAEQAFYKQNSWYDYGNLLWNLGEQLFWIYRSLTAADKASVAAQFGLGEGLGFEAIIAIFLSRIDELATNEPMRLDRSYVASIRRYRSIITFMNDFYRTLRANPQKDTPFQNTALQRLLKAAGFIAGSD